MQRHKDKSVLQRIWTGAGYRNAIKACIDDTDFGLERVKEYFLQNKSQNASDLCNTLLTEMQQFTCAPPTHNDVTALALARRAAIASG
jgi:hypothetical protein